jgi:hypothetical protein
MKLAQRNILEHGRRMQGHKPFRLATASRMQYE